MDMVDRLGRDCVLKELAKSFALQRGFLVRRAIDAATVRGMLAKLHPVETHLPLIRLGGDGDGGYLVPDDLDGIAACFSPGVDVTASFEEAMVARGIRCFLVDGSVASAPLNHPLIAFEPRFLGVVNDPQTTTLADWVEAKAPAEGGDLILQMDIEGHEWAVLLNTPEALLRRFRIIVVEFHGLSRSYDHLLQMQMDAALARLDRLFHVVHAHPNNNTPMSRRGDLHIPDLLEVTYLRRDRAEALQPATVFPHPLDRSNMPGVADPPLPAALRGVGPDARAQ
jgi:hypothetical protein